MHTQTYIQKEKRPHINAHTTVPNPNALFPSPGSRQAFSELMASGRLAPGHTDVSPYEVDGCVRLAEVFHGLRRHYYWTPSEGGDGAPSTNAALALTAHTP